MRLAERLLLGALIVVGVFALAVGAIASERLRARLYDQTAAELQREATVAAARWRAGTDADALADSLGALDAHRVTLVDSAGNVVGDSEFGRDELARLENHGSRPEIAEAVRAGVGRAQRPSPSRGDDELYVAVRAPLGVARVAVGTRTVDRIVAGARTDVWIAALAATLVALVLAWLFARSISRPIAELSDAAGAIAAGEPRRRLPLAAPGEVGDLASALHSMSEQLASRLNALEQNDALMSALVDSLDEGVIAVDSREQVVRVNSAARRLLSLPPVVPFPADDLSRDPELRAALADALRGNATDAVELGLRGRTVVLTARPLAAGGAVLALLDLTTIRRLETVRRDFVANVSHELRTPLTVIAGFSETLADDDPPPEQRRKFIDAIRSNAVRMQRLVDDLLDLSRIESGGWHPMIARVDIPALLGEVASTIETHAAKSAVRIVVDVAPDASVVSADAMAVRQVLSNLAENALRHTESGTVRIFAHRVAGGVELGVADTGSGIAAQHLPRIFERFYRADPSRSRAAGGTGLGLSIVKHLVEAHGGRVRARSEIGVGTEVTAFFPDPSPHVATTAGA